MNARWSLTIETFICLLWAKHILSIAGLFYEDRRVFLLDFFQGQRLGLEFVFPERTLTAIVWILFSSVVFVFVCLHFENGNKKMLQVVNTIFCFVLFTK